MQDWIDCGRSFRDWWFLGLVALAVCLLAAGALMLAAHAGGGLQVLVAGAAAAVAAGLSAAGIASGRCRVQIVPQGFVVHDSQGERTFSDEQVICASLRARSNYKNGEFKSTTRTFEVWVEDDFGPHRLQMVNRIPVEADDPLAPLIARVHGQLYDRARAAIADRQSFEGEGWMVGPEHLVVSPQRHPREVGFEELAAVDVFDKYLCVWKAGDEEPAVRIPIESANAHVLARLLRERVSLRPGEAEPAPGGGLGRILFERKPGRGLIGLIWGLPCLALGILLLLIVIAVIDRRPGPAIGGAACAAVLGLVWLIPLSQCVRLRCCEHGLSRRWLWRETRLLYANVHSFAYAAVRQYVKGVYSGTTFTLTFISGTGRSAQRLAYSRTLRHADDELEHLRDRVSQVIAARMAQEFADGQAVSWTAGLRFLPDGLEYRPSGFLRRKPPVILRYEEIHGYHAGQGVFHLWIAGTRKPVVKENVSQPNFHPGFLFLCRLLASSASARSLEVSGTP